MAWANRDYRAYPARCPSHHALAAEASPDPVLLGAWVSRSEAQSEALMLRQYRYLVRANPGVNYHLDSLFAGHYFRTSLAQNDFGDWCLYLRAMPALAADIIALNPALAGIA